MKEDISISNLILEKRKELNLTLDDLSKMTGLSKSYLSRIENGERKSPSVSSIEKIYKAFNIKHTDEVYEGLDEQIEGLKQTLLLFNKKGDISLTEAIGIMEQVNSIVKFRR